MIGDVLVEQKDRQANRLTPEEEAAVAKVGRRNARKVARSRRQGYFGLAKAIMDAKHRPSALEPKDTRVALNFDHPDR